MFPPPSDRHVISKEKKLKAYIKPFIIGVFVYYIILQLRIMFDTIIASSDLMNSGNSLVFFISIILSIALMVLPSYVAGWLSIDKGTFLGFLVGLVGCSLPFCISLILKDETAFSFFEILSKWFEKAILSSILGAVSGAAAQLHSQQRSL